MLSSSLDICPTFRIPSFGLPKERKSSLIEDCPFFFYSLRTELAQQYKRVILPIPERVPMLATSLSWEPVGILFAVGFLAWCLSDCLPPSIIEKTKISSLFPFFQTDEPIRTTETPTEKKLFYIGSRLAVMPSIEKKELAPFLVGP